MIVGIEELRDEVAGEHAVLPAVVEHLEQFLARVADSDQGCDDRPDRGPRDADEFDAAILAGTEGADVREAAHSAALEDAESSHLG